MAEKNSASHHPLSEGVVGCAAAMNAIRGGLGSHCCNAAQSRPICDDLVGVARGQQASLVRTLGHVPGTSSSGFIFSKYRLPNLAE